MFNFLTFMFGFVDKPNTNSEPYKYNFTLAYIGITIMGIVFILYTLAIIFNWQY